MTKSFPPRSVFRGTHQHYTPLTESGTRVAIPMTLDQAHAALWALSVVKSNDTDWQEAVRLFARDTGAETGQERSEPALSRPDWNRLFPSAANQPSALNQNLTFHIVSSLVRMAEDMSGFGRGMEAGPNRELFEYMASNDANPLHGVKADVRDRPVSDGYDRPADATGWPGSGEDYNYACLMIESISDAYGNPEELESGFYIVQAVSSGICDHFGSRAQAGLTNEAESDNPDEPEAG